MASTSGGFLMGFGLCILLVSLGGYLVLGQYYAQIMRWRGTIEQLYWTTHSPFYESAMNSLKTLSPHASWLADNIGWIPGAGWLADSLRQISRAASLMEEVYYQSESAYRAIAVVEVAPQYLQYGMVFGFFLIVVGVILVARARRKALGVGGDR